MQLSSSPLRSVGTFVALASILALAGCAGEAGSSSAPVSKGAARVAVTLSNTGGKDVCTLDHSSAAAGPITFTVKNESSTAITEVELQSQGRILGEKENLAPGLKPVSFTLTLTGGKYQVYCPGADKPTQNFTVTGNAARSTGGTTQALLAEGTKGYGTYVDGVVAGMVTAVDNLKTAVDSGNLSAAKTQYALARPFYERIESDVEGFVLPGFSPTDNAGNLDYLIDMRQSNLDPVVGWHGFHAIERDLWQNGAITPDTQKLATELQTNVTKLSKLVDTLNYKPEDLANGAASLLEEVQSEKIKGEEEAFSHLDLVDFAANVEGAQQAFAFLEPGLKRIDPALTKQVNTQFDNVNAMLKTYEDPTAPGGYVLYTPALRATDAAKLSQAVQALQDPLSKIAEKVATAA
jgi:iron uptake system component EfeO